MVRGNHGLTARPHRGSARSLSPTSIFKSRLQRNLAAVGEPIPLALPIYPVRLTQNTGSENAFLGYSACNLQLRLRPSNTPLHWLNISGELTSAGRLFIAHVGCLGTPGDGYRNTVSSITTRLENDLNARNTLFLAAALSALTLPGLASAACGVGGSFGGRR